MQIVRSFPVCHCRCPSISMFISSRSGGSSQLPSSTWRWEGRKVLVCKCTLNYIKHVLVWGTAHWVRGFYIDLGIHGNWRLSSVWIPLLSADSSTEYLHLITDSTAETFPFFFPSSTQPCQIITNSSWSPSWSWSLWQSSFGSTWDMWAISWRKWVTRRT